MRFDFIPEWNCLRSLELNNNKMMWYAVFMHIRVLWNLSNQQHGSVYIYLKKLEKERK